MPKLIVTTGPESSGKTVLATQLAEFYGAPLIDEYSREYLSKIGTDYTADDVLKIAEGQLTAQQEIMSSSAPFVFSDTGLLVAKIWYEYRYGEKHPWLEEQFLKQEVSLYLLCGAEIPWEFDPLRENPFDRPELFEAYQRALEEAGKPFQVVSGRHTARLNDAVNAVDAL